MIGKKEHTAYEFSSYANRLWFAGWVGYRPRRHCDAVTLTDQWEQKIVVRAGQSFAHARIDAWGTDFPRGNTQEDCAGVALDYLRTLRAEGRISRIEFSAARARVRAMR